MPYDPMMSNIDNRISELEEEITFLENLAYYPIALKDSDTPYYKAWIRLIAKCKNELEKHQIDKLRHQNHNKKRGIKY